MLTLGDRSRIVAIVGLARDSENRQATLEPLSVGAALKHLIYQNFAEEIPVGEIFDQLHRIAASVPRYLLRYHGLEDASDLLAGTFGRLRERR
jgi:hypothetical protein